MAPLASEAIASPYTVLTRKDPQGLEACREGLMVYCLLIQFLRVRPNVIVEVVQKGKTIVREDDFADQSMLLVEG